MTPEGHVLVRATATSTAAELEAEARRALALLKARAPAVKTFGELDDWSQLRRMARTNRGAEPEALDLVARWPVPPDVVVSAAFVAALAGAAYDYSVRAAFLHARVTPEAEAPATTGRAVGTFRELPEWQELRLWASQIDRRPLTLKQIDRIADWPVPPGVQVSPVFVLDTAWLCLGYYVPQEPPARGETKGR